MKLLAVVLLAFALAACAVAPTRLSGLTAPVAAVRAAGENPNGGARGRFIFTVNAVGVTARQTFLDSASNYRDHDNLAVAMSHQMAQQVAQHLGMPLAELKHRRIVVRGIAKRVRVYFVRDGRYTGDYYYQTHVHVSSPTQISFAR